MTDLSLEGTITGFYGNVAEVVLGVCVKRPLKWKFFIPSRLTALPDVVPNV